MSQGSGKKLKIKGPLSGNAVKEKAFRGLVKILKCFSEVNLRSATKSKKLSENH